MTKLKPKTEKKPRDYGLRISPIDPGKLVGTTKPARKVIG